jgi:transposase
MSSLPVFCGMDYHDRVVEVSVMESDGRELTHKRCANDVEEIVDVAERFQRPVHAAIEACTGAAALADVLVNRRGWSVDLAHPGYVSRLKQSPDKDDYDDAKLLADLERVGYVPRVWLAPEAIRELRRVVRYRQPLVRERRNIKLRVRALLRESRVVSPDGCAWTKRWIEWLRTRAELPAESRWIVERHLKRLELTQREIRVVERRLRQRSREDVLVEKLESFHGIGLITAVTLRAEIGRFDRFRSGKQLSRFCGISPRNASSGHRQADAGLVKAGNPELRTVLIEAAHRLMRCDPRWRRMGLQLRGNGKPGSVVAAAVANRWMRWLFHQVKSYGLAAERNDSADTQAFGGGTRGPGSRPQSPTPFPLPCVPRKRTKR